MSNYSNLYSVKYGLHVGMLTKNRKRWTLRAAFTILLLRSCFCDPAFSILLFRSCFCDQFFDLAFAILLCDPVFAILFFQSYFCDPVFAILLFQSCSCDHALPAARLLFLEEAVFLMQYQYVLILMRLSPWIAAPRTSNCPPQRSYTKNRRPGELDLMRADHSGCNSSIMEPRRVSLRSNNSTERDSMSARKSRAENHLSIDGSRVQCDACKNGMQEICSSLFTTSFSNLHFLSSSFFLYISLFLSLSFYLLLSLCLSVSLSH